MDYVKHYNLLVEKAKHRNCLSEYKEKHHIVPRCMGGSNKSHNLVELTAREHYIAHLLLAKIYGGKLWHAVNLMNNFKKYSKSKNRSYEKARIEHSKLVSEQNKRTFIKPKELRNYTCSNCNANLVYKEFCHHVSKKHYYCNATCRNQYIAKCRPSQLGKKKNRTAPAWNKGIKNPNAANNGKKGASKLSLAATGRTRSYKEDGTWTWKYPIK
jgi:hypothetical protein